MLSQWCETAECFQRQSELLQRHTDMGKRREGEAVRVGGGASSLVLNFSLSITSGLLFISLKRLILFIKLTMLTFFSTEAVRGCY